MTSLIAGFDENKTRKVLIERETPDIVSCNEWRPFWMTWSEGGIYFGKGRTVGSQELFRMTTEKVGNISGIALRSGHKDGAHWEFLKSQGLDQYNCMVA